MSNVIDMSHIFATSKTKNSLIQRVEALVRRHHDGDVKYREFSLPLSTDDQIQIGLYEKNPVVHLAESFYGFPVQGPGRVLGAFEVRFFGSEPEAEQIDRLSDAIKWIVEDLRREIPVGINEAARRTAYNFPVLVCTPDASENFKIAKEIYDESGRYAFFPFKDIEPTVLSVDDFKSLGNCTIYIENIQELCSESVERLTTYLSSDRAKDDPQIIATTTVGSAEIKTLLPKQFLVHLTELQIPTTQALQAFRSTGLAETILNSSYQTSM